MMRITKPGFMTSVQDLGRIGYRHFGVPVSGACDSIAAKRVNALLENASSDAVLECTMIGPEISFEAATFLAISGADMQASLDGVQLEMNKVYAVNEGSTLSCGNIGKGLRAYIGIRGGIDAPEVLGSRSFYFPVTEKGQLAKGDGLAFEPSTQFEPKVLKISSSDLYRETDLTAYPGPEFGILSETSRKQLLGSPFTISKDFDRMACRLTETLDPHNHKLITSATLPGSVQYTPAGQLMVLERDGQTTGGYPRILQLDERSLCILAQKRAGDTIRFNFHENSLGT